MTVHLYEPILMTTEIVITPMQRDTDRPRRQEKIIVQLPGQEPKSGIATWFYGPQSLPDAKTTPGCTLADGTIIRYEPLD